MRTRFRANTSVSAPLTACIALLWTASAAAQVDVGTAFNYQGQLRDDGAAANAPYDFEFRLFDPVSGQVGPTLNVNDLQVTAGLFTTVLDFGDVFFGRRRMLEIRVRPGASGGAYTVLSPQQELTITPHAGLSLRSESLDFPYAQTGISAGAPVGTPLLSITDNGVGAVAQFTATANNGSNTALSVSSNIGRALSASVTGASGSAAQIAATSTSHSGSSVVLTQSNGSSDAFFAATQVQGTGHAALFRNFNPGNLTPTVLVDTQSSQNFAVALHATLSGAPVGSFATAVKGSAGSGGSGIGVWGHHDGDAWGVYGSTNTGIGVVGSSGPLGFAGWFDGTVQLDADVLLGASSTLTFPAVLAATPPMIEMFTSGSTNADRMVIAHSSDFPNWGLQYQDVGERFNFLAGGVNVLTVDLNNRRLGVRTATPAFDLEVNGTAGKPGGGAWSVSSDARLKTNIRPLRKTLDRVLALRGVSFEYIDPQTIHELPGEQIGMLAQEVEAVFPQWIDEGPAGYKRLTVRGFEALAVEALRELRAEKDDQVARLQVENADLRARLEALEATIANLQIASSSAVPHTVENLRN